MAGDSNPDKRFGDIAIDMQLVSREKLDRALVVQGLIFSRTKVHMAIGKVLKEMGALTEEHIKLIIKTQSDLATGGGNGDNGQDNCGSQLPGDASESENEDVALSLTLPKDKLSAFISPTKKIKGNLTLEAVKEFLEGRSVVHGLVEDQVLSAYLAQSPLPMEPFKVATGSPAIPGIPPEIIYHFDTDPLRIGTLKEDGTMDWKDKGDIPQVKVGDILIEKTEGQPGQPGISVFGKEIPPPRLRNPKLKYGKGAQRSEDGRHILAKIDGTPKQSSDGKVFVFDMLNIDSDIGVETGHIEYEGYVEATGGVNAGYTVKAKGLRTAEIQDATIEVEEDLVCHGGIYGTRIKAGGNLKASHIHNCTIAVMGELVVKKEIYDSTIESSSRCLIVDGKLIDCKIDAKKGVYAKDIGSEGSTPCELTVGYDRRYERDMAAIKTEKEDLEQQVKDAQALYPSVCKELESITKEIGALAQEQDNFMLQKRQFEEQLRGEGPNPVDEDDKEERSMLNEMIAELVDRNEELDTRARTLMAKEDKVRMQSAGIEKQIKILEAHIENVIEKIEVLEASHKVDPGIAEVKVHGKIINKTQIIGPHKKMILPQDLHRVRIAETKVDTDSNRFQMKISNL
jgi:uncharacterized protein